MPLHFEERSGSDFECPRLTHAALVLATLLVLPQLALASPCRGVDRSLTPKRAVLLGPAVAEELAVEKVEVLGSFRVKSWSIVYIRPPAADDVFVFYSKEPRAGRHVTLWGGVAMRVETITANRGPSITTSAGVRGVWPVLETGSLMGLA